jgi:SAM-dependent methyltransferase
MGWNKILENKARLEYLPIVVEMGRVIPQSMARKIWEANVQQAFVVDAVLKLSNFSGNYLCVGAFEDTACEFLETAHEIKIDKTDMAFGDLPFEKQPLNKKYDCIFSTSVLEHVDNPVEFITAICNSLNPNGIGILTCDFAENWPQGMEYPPTDQHMFNEKDLQIFNDLIDGFGHREDGLGCELVDTPQWDNAPKDFTYQGKYKYDFATFVFRKVS